MLTALPFALVTPFGTYDMITIEMADIEPDFGGGYTTLIGFPSGGGTNVTASPITIEAFYGATDSGAIAPPVSGVAADITGVTDLTGQVQILAGGIQLAFTGLNMGIVDGAPFGEAADLDLTANLNFFGEDSIPVPEPGTAALLSLGLVGLASARRSRRS